MTPRKGRRLGEVEERILSVPKATGPILVCGLPGSGYVGKLAADHLVGALKAKKVAEYFCESFPPQVSVKEDGTAEPPKAELFFARAGRSRGVFIFTADAQPSTSRGEYELADAVVGFASRRGVKSVYALAAYITGSFPSEPKVYGAATSSRMLKSLAAEGVTLMKEGGVSGMNGLAVGMAGLRGLEGACLLGETSGYLVDAGASRAVLDVLSRLTGIPVDTRKLQEKAEETKKVISQLQSMADQSQERVQQPRRDSRPEYIA